MSLEIFRLAVIARIHRLLGPVCWLVVLIAGTWLLAGQVWRFMLPQGAPVIGHGTEAVAVAEAVAARHLFGETVQASVPAAAPSSYRLLGVIAAGEGKSGVALLDLNGKGPVAVSVGGVVEPGVIVHSVESWSVRLDQGGRLVALALPEGSMAGDRKER